MLANHLIAGSLRTPRRPLAARHFPALAAVCLALLFCLTPGCSGGGCTDSAINSVRDGLQPGGEPEPEAVPDEDLSKKEVVTQRDKAKAKLDSAANAIGWIAGLCAIAALGTMILSFIVPLIPTKTAIGCFAAAVAGYVLQYALLVYGVMFSEIAIWLGVVVLGAMGLSVGLPWMMTVSNLVQARAGKKLIVEGDTRAGVALIAEAAALTPPERVVLLKEATRDPLKASIAATKRMAKLAKKITVPAPA